MDKVITVGTWLPCFPGFYGTRFEPSEDSVLEYIDNTRRELGLIGRSGDITYPYPEFDYDSYRAIVARRYTELVESELKELFPSLSMVYENISSPREYNFVNDSVNVQVTMEHKELLDFITAHTEEFEEYIKEHYTSYDGFMSHYSNDHMEWLWEWAETVQHKHMLGAMLQFALHTNGTYDFDPDLPELELTEEWYTKLTTLHIVNGEFVEGMVDRQGDGIPGKQLYQLEREGFVFRSDMLENIALNKEFTKSYFPTIEGVLQKGDELWATHVTVPIFDADCWRVR